MHHRWLLLAACFWVIFMFMVASKFITLTFKDPDVHGAKPVIPTTITEVGKDHVTKEKRLPGQFQTIGKGLSEDLVHEGLVHIERLELLRNVCQDASLKNLTHTPVSKFVLDRIFVCDKHKILFCQTPKVGNTQWKKVLIVLNGAFPSIDEIPENIVHDHEKNGLPRLSSFSDSALPFQEASGRWADLSPATHVRCGWRRACAPCSPGWRLGGLSRAVLPSVGEDELYNGSELHKRPSPEIVAVACSSGSREGARAVRFLLPLTAVSTAGDRPKQGWRRS